MAVKYTNNAKSTLASGINSSVTSATVADGSIFPALGAGEYFYITFDDGSNNEIAKVTARSGNTLTLVRAQDNTTARAFSTGDSAELRVIAAVLTEIQENIAAKSANQTVYSATAASNATDYNIGVDPGVEANASVFLDGVYQHHDTFSFSGSTLTFDAAPTNGTKIEVVVDNLINLQSSNLTVDTFTATSGQTAFTLSDAPGGESNVLAFIDGVFQNQASFTLSSNTLTFDTGVVVGRSVTIYTINPVNIGTPSDNTVTSAKLSGNITLPGSLTVGAYDVAFDSPTFVVDNSNGYVGIGTASPSSVLDVVGEVKTSSHINIGGNLVKASGDLTLDSAGDIILDADGGDITLSDGGTAFGQLRKSSSDFKIQSNISDGDITFVGSDGGSDITALTLDISEAGAATFNSSVLASIINAGTSSSVGVGAATADANVAELGPGYLNLGRDDTADAKQLVFSKNGVRHAYLETASAGMYIESIKDLQYRTTMTNSTAGHHIFKSYNTEIMRLDGGTNKVGIGTGASPGYILEVKGAPSADWLSRIYNTANDGYGLLVRTDATTANNAIALGVYADSAYRMVVRSTGRIGMGITDPARRKLEIQDASPGIVFHDSDETNLTHEILGGGNAGLEISADYQNVKAGAGYIRLDVGGTERARVSGTTATNVTKFKVGTNNSFLAGDVRVNTASISGGVAMNTPTMQEFRNVCSTHGGGSNNYWHIKTNFKCTNNIMFVARMHGYAYGNSGSIIEVLRSGYAYSGSGGSIINSATANNGTSSHTLETYKASDDYVCFRGYWVGGYYTGASFDISMYSPTGYNWNLQILAQALNTTSGTHF